MIKISTILHRISETYRRKAVARDWFGNGETISLRGKLEFLQQNEYDITNVELNLDGLHGKMSGYHVHMVIYYLHHVNNKITFLFILIKVFTL